MCRLRGAILTWKCLLGGPERGLKKVAFSKNGRFCVSFRVRFWAMWDRADFRPIFAIYANLSVQSCLCPPRSAPKKGLKRSKKRSISPVFESVSGPREGARISVQYSPYMQICLSSHVFVPREARRKRAQKGQNCLKSDFLKQKGSFLKKLIFCVFWCRQPGKRHFTKTTFSKKRVLQGTYPVLFIFSRKWPFFVLFLTSFC